jgi:hypothetical protein
MNPLDTLKAAQRAKRAAAPAEEYKPIALPPANSTNPLDHVKRKKAGQARQPAAKAEPIVLPGQLAQYQAAVDAALSRMADFPAMSQERESIKREAIADLWPFVSGYMQAGFVYPNSVAVQVMIWAFDVGDIERALQIGLYLITTGNQVMPPKFDRRDLETFVADALYDWANARWKAKESASPYLADTLAAMDGPAPWPLHGIVRGKLYAMAAKHCDLMGEWESVVRWCEKAQEANPEGAGVKTLLNTAKAKLATRT